MSRVAMPRRCQAGIDGDRGDVRVLEADHHARVAHDLAADPRHASTRASTAARAPRGTATTTTAAGRPAPRCAAPTAGGGGASSTISTVMGSVITPAVRSRRRRSGRLPVDRGVALAQVPRGQLVRRHELLALEPPVPRAPAAPARSAPRGSAPRTRRGRPCRELVAVALHAVAGEQHLGPAGLELGHDVARRVDGVARSAARGRRAPGGSGPRTPPCAARRSPPRPRGACDAAGTRSGRATRCPPPGCRAPGPSPSRWSRRRAAR